MHFDNWILVLLVVIVSLLRWLATKAGTSKPGQDQKQQPQPRRRPEETQPRRTPPLSDEEQIRKFLEALGQPRTAKPPPPVPPRTDIAPRPVAPVQPPRSAIPIPEIPRPRPAPQPRPVTSPVPTVVQRRRAEMIPGKVEPRYQAARPSPAAAPVFEVHETAVPLPEMTQAMTSPVQTTAQVPASDQQQDRSLAGLLRNARSVRDAIILREILGKPRSLQPLEDLPGTA